MKKQQQTDFGIFVPAHFTSVGNREPMCVNQSIDPGLVDNQLKVKMSGW